MDIAFLSRSLKESICKQNVGKILHAVRINQTFSGEIGEAWILVCENGVLLPQRHLGKVDYEIKQSSTQTLRKMRCERTGNTIKFEFDGGCGCVSFGEADALETLLASLKPDLPPARVSQRQTLFVAGLLYAAGCDQELTSEEENFLRQHTTAAALENAQTYCANHSPEEYFTEISADFNLPRQTSLLANQLELLMADCEFTRIEMDFLKAEIAALSYPIENYRFLRDALIQKNQFATLFE